MADVTIISVPRTGTQFLLYFLLVEQGLDVRFFHFTSSCASRVEAVLNDPPHTIIVTSGNRARVESEFTPDAVTELYRQRDIHMPALLAAGAIEFNITANTLAPVLTKLNISRTPDIDAFESEWPVISPRNPTARYNALKGLLNDNHRFWMRDFNAAP